MRGVAIAYLALQFVAVVVQADRFGAALSAIGLVLVMLWAALIWRGSKFGVGIATAICILNTVSVGVPRGGGETVALVSNVATAMVLVVAAVMFNRRRWIKVGLPEDG